MFGSYRLEKDGEIMLFWQGFGKFSALQPQLVAAFSMVGQSKLVRCSLAECQFHAIRI